MEKTHSILGNNVQNIEKMKINKIKSILYNGDLTLSLPEKKVGHPRYIRSNPGDKPANMIHTTYT